VIRVVNPVIRVLLRSPAHGLLSKQLMLLKVTGRKSGRVYTIPVGRHELDGELVVSAAGAWRHNLRGGAPVRVIVDGRERGGYAELEEDPEQVAHVYKTLLDRVGIKKARQVGLKVNLDRLPTAEEVGPAVAQRGIARIRLTDA
jgi:hypothetical protein